MRVGRCHRHAAMAIEATTAIAIAAMPIAIHAEYL